jgi:hypothetical protein
MELANCGGKTYVYVNTSYAKENVGATNEDWTGWLGFVVQRQLSARLMELPGKDRRQPEHPALAGC